MYMKSRKSQNSRTRIVVIVLAVLLAAAMCLAFIPFGNNNNNVVTPTIVTTNSTTNTAVNAPAPAAIPTVAPFTITAVATKAPTDDIPEIDTSMVLLSYDGEEYTVSDIDQVLLNMNQQGYTVSIADYQAAVDYLTYQLTVKAEIKKLGLDQFTDEQMAEIKAEAYADGLDYWNSDIESYVRYNSTGEEGEDLDALRKTADEILRANGYTPESIGEMYIEDVSNQKSSDALFAIYLDGVELPEPTEAEILDVYDQVVEQDKTYINGSVVVYEVYQQADYGLLYRPAGYRSILHILLSVDKGLLNAYNAALDSYQNGAGATKQDVEEAKAAVLASRQGTIDDIYSRLEKGESFESLIELYGEDPGMEGENALANGYAVHEESIMYDQAFTDGAFNSKLSKPGDYGDPIVTSYGIHILYYLRDIPEGAEPMTDEMRQQIYDYLVSNKEAAYVQQAIAPKMQEHNVFVNTKGIELATEVANAKTNSNK